MNDEENNGDEKEHGACITLEGSGDRTGRDIDNAMGLAEAYERIVMRKP